MAYRAELYFVKTRAGRSPHDCPTHREGMRQRGLVATTHACYRRRCGRAVWPDLIRCAILLHLRRGAGAGILGLVAHLVAVCAGARREAPIAIIPERSLRMPVSTRTILVAIASCAATLAFVTTDAIATRIVRVET